MKIIDHKRFTASEMTNAELVWCRNVHMQTYMRNPDGEEGYSKEQYEIELWYNPDCGYTRFEITLKAEEGWQAVDPNDTHTVKEFVHPDRYFAYLSNTRCTNCIPGMDEDVPEDEEHDAALDLAERYEEWYNYVHRYDD